MGEINTFTFHKSYFVVFYTDVIYNVLNQEIFHNIDIRETFLMKAPWTHDRVSCLYNLFLLRVKHGFRNGAFGLYWDVFNEDTL